MKAPAVVVAALACAACKDPVVVEGRGATVRLDVRAASAPDALEGSDVVGSLAVTLFREDPPGDPFRFFVGLDGTVVDESGLPAPQPELGPASRARVIVWGMTPLGEPYSLGRSAPFALPAEGAVDVPVFLAVIDRFTDAGAARLVRSDGALVALDDGRVLAVGGRDGTAFAAPALYDHGAGDDVELAGGLYALHVAACALDGGRALVVGGESSDGTPQGGVWLFDGDALTSVGAVDEAVSGAHLACVPGSERAFVVGGMQAAAVPSAAVVEIALSGGAATVTPRGDLLQVPRAFGTITRLSLADRSAFLVAGGVGEGGAALASAEVIEVVENGDLVVKAPSNTGHAAASVDLGAPRFEHAAVRVSPTAVLVFGGADESGPLASASAVVFSAEISDPGAFLPLDAGASPALDDTRIGAAAALLPDGSVVIAGGTADDEEALRLSFPAEQNPATADAYQADVERIDTSAIGMGATAAVLADDSALFAGGRTSAGQPAAAQLLVLCDVDESCAP